MHVTYRQLFTANAALAAINATPQPFALRLKLARLARLIEGPLRDFQQAQLGMTRAAAERDDIGEPIGLRRTDGAVVFKLDPTVELRLSADIDRLRNETVELADVPPLSWQDFTKVGKDDNAVSVDALAGLGPFCELAP